VQLVNITPLTQCSAPLRGTIFYNPPQESDTSARIYLNLNDPAEPAGYEIYNKISPDYFGHYTIALTYGETFTFQIDAAVHNEYCAFSLRLTIIANGRRLTKDVNDAGQPFRVTSLLPDPPAGPSFAGYGDLYFGGSYADSVFGYHPNAYGATAWKPANPKTYKGSR
jgi:hypothetical protein